uniref:Myb/SANT-like DNA-binding domain-containing protein n=1 Tax=Cyclopterus lumpus TaxID=8103 RepID=A0A8C2X335_CYCLU
MVNSVVSCRAIRKEMGIQGALTPQQLKKKWDNLKDKYRNPPVGMETQTNSWRWFHLMDEAMSGARPSLLSEDAAAIALLLPKTEGGSPGPGPGSRALGGVGTLSGIEAESRTGSPVQFSAIPDRVHVSPPARNESQTALLYAAHVPDEARLEALQREWRALEAEQAEFDGELIALERDRELLSRDTAALERDRVLLERDREVLDRDRVVLDRDRAFLDRDRAFLDRDRVFLERAREDLERERALLRKEREGPAGRTTEKERKKRG